MSTHRRVTRMLLAYAVQYDDGSVGFRQVLECDHIQVDYDADVRVSPSGRWARYGDQQRYTVTATGRTMHEWPGSWQRADDADPPQIEGGPLLIEGERP